MKIIITALESYYLGHFNDLLIVLEVLKRESGYQQNRLQGQD